jgi:hypothetical protein
VNASECLREPDVVDAVRSGQWPDRGEPGLRTHVESCAVCAEVAAVALALHAARENAWCAVRVPTAAHVWWRAQRRARQEAVRAAERPMTIVEGVAAASAIGLASAAIVAGWMAVPRGWMDVVSAPASAFILAGAGAALLLIPVAVYFAVSER